GSSGGPLLTSDGKVAGVTTAARRDAQNLNFAVPVSRVRQLLTAPYRKRYLSQGRSIGDLEFSALRQLPFESDAYSILCEARGQITKRNYDGAIETLEGAIGSVPREFSYLRYFLL